MHLNVHVHDHMTNIVYSFTRSSSILINIYNCFLHYSHIVLNIHVNPNSYFPNDHLIIDIYKVEKEHEAETLLSVTLSQLDLLYHNHRSVITDLTNNSPQGFSLS